MSGGPGEHTLPYSTEAGVHPLAGLPKPQGDPDAVMNSGNAFGRASKELDNLAHRLNAAVGDVVGGTWIGKAGSSCEQAVGNLATGYTKAGGYAREAGGILVECSNAWRAALENYKRAEWLAGEALEQEAIHRQEAEQRAQQHAAAGDDVSARLAQAEAESWESPARDQASRIAHESIQAFNQATQKACATLDALSAPVQEWLSAIGVSGGGAIDATRRVYKYGSTRWVRNIPGYVTSEGEIVPRKGYVPDWGMRGKWTSRARWLGRAGNALAFVTAGWGQWAMDQRKHPNMEADERVGRAGMSGVTEGLGGAAVGFGAGWLAGAAAGAAFGSVVPGIGTAVGFVVGAGVGYFASGWIDKHDDWFVKGAGNLADGAGDWVSDKWHDWTPW